MTKKIIVADDSQTIQKVIKISFANQGHELVSCLSENELMKNLNQGEALVLLDFSLSENKSGYDLAKIIKEKNKNVPILALLGTFDSIDESQFQKSGFSDKLVKPFETEKFLRKCESLLAANREDVFEEAAPEESEDYSGWDVESPEIEENTSDEEVTNDFASDVEMTAGNSDTNELASELGGWGFDKSELMARDLTNDYSTFPPVIEDTSKIASKFLAAGSFSENATDEELESFGTEDVNDLSDEDSTSEFDLNQLKSSAQHNLEELIEEETSQETPGTDSEALFSVEDLDANDFWSVDEEVSSDLLPENNKMGDLHLVEDEEISYTISEDKESSEPIEFSYKVNQEELKNPINKTMPSFSPDEMMASIKNDITPIIEKYVRQYCQDNIEKIMWEIIPDIAENLIKREIKEISKAVQKTIDN